MPRFPFVDMTARARKAPLGPVTLNQLKANAEAVDALAHFEHTIAGRHNALEVPRVVGHSVYGAGVYTEYLYTDSDYWVGSNNPAVGQIDLVLDATGFVAPYISGLVSCCDEDVLNKPWMANLDIVDSENVSIYLMKLSSALGAGNTWAATDGSFCVALNSVPVAQSPTLSTIASRQRRDWFDDETTSWNAVSAFQAALRKNALVEHDSSGNHSAIQIAREYGHITYDSGTNKYNKTAGDISAVSIVSTGVCDVTTSRTFASTGNMAAFLEVLPSSSTDLYVINFRPTSTTTVRVYIYQYSAGSWSRANADFFIAVYGS